MKHRQLTLGVLCAAASLSLATPTATGADSTDPAVLAAQQAQALAEAKKATAEADLAAAKARFGEVTQPLPTGAGTATNLNIEGKILAYRAADKAADQIAAAIRTALAGQTPSRIVFLSVKEVTNIALLQAFDQQASALLEQVSQLQIPGGIPRPCPKGGVQLEMMEVTPPGVAIDAALTLLRLFKTDRTLVGEDVTLDDFAIVALLAGKLSGIDIVYPPSYFPDAFGWKDIPEVYDKFNKLAEAQITVANLPERIAAKKQEIADRKTQAGTDKACAAMLDADAARLEEFANKVSVFKEALAQVNTALTKTSDQSGMALIQSLVLAERLATRMQGAFLLQVKPIAAGGTTHTSTNIFGTTFSFSGGAIVSYVLYRPDGIVATAGTVPVFAGLFKDEKLNDALQKAAPNPQP